jgi:hypothetical protein
VSASPLDSTTTSWTWFGAVFQTDNIDRTLYEESGFNHVFAIWNVNATKVSVDIYAGGKDLSVVVTLCYLAGFLVVGLLCVVFVKSHRRISALVSVLLFVAVVTGVFVFEYSLSKPRFQFQLDR